MHTKGWTRALRRTAAVFMATVTLWFLSLTTDFSAAAQAIRTLGESPVLVQAALNAELGVPTAEAAILDTWSRLAVGQSSLLSAGEETIRAAMTAPTPTVSPRTRTGRSPGPRSPPRRHHRPG